MKFLCGCLHQFPAEFGAHGCPNCHGDEGPACASVDLADPAQAHDAEDLVRCTREVFEADAIRAQQRAHLAKQINRIAHECALDQLKRINGGAPWPE